MFFTVLTRGKYCIVLQNTHIRHIVKQQSDGLPLLVINSHWRNMIHFIFIFYSCNWKMIHDFVCTAPVFVVVAKYQAVIKTVIINYLTRGSSNVFIEALKQVSLLEVSQRGILHSGIAMLRK